MHISERIKCRLLERGSEEEIPVKEEMVVVCRMVVGAGLELLVSGGGTRGQCVRWRREKTRDGGGSASVVLGEF